MPNFEGIIQELRQERDRLDAAINALTSLSGNTPQTGRSSTGGKRKVSALARRRMAAAQRARWAKAKGTSTKPKRHISPAGLARIRAAQRARWAKVRKAA